MWNRLKDVWFLFCRLFPFPTKPGLRKVGNPDSASPVLVTGNFELTVRRVMDTLKRDGIDAWLLVVPTKGVNVWCAASAGEFSTDRVVSIINTTRIEDLVEHRRLILPQLSGSGVNIWALEERTGWKPRFGPTDINDLAAYLERGKRLTEPHERLVKFDLKNRLVMGANLGFSVSLLLVLPLLIVSIWIDGLWWKTLPLLFALSVLSSVLVFWLPGKVGLQKGLSLGLMAAAVFIVPTMTLTWLSPGSVLAWSVWILLAAGYTGYDLASWSPLWRQDPKELLTGVKQTHVEIEAEKCIGCHLCDVVCPEGVFGYVKEACKYEVVNLGACIACGACIENCPTNAIANNFRAGECACPTCYAIDKIGRLTSTR